MRLFYAPNVDAVHTLDSDESKHLVRVLRANVGDRIGLVDGKGHRYQGILTEADKRRCVVSTELVETQPAPKFPLTLVIAPTKSTDRFEWLLEKAMEYGVHKIQPVWTERSERKTEKAERWEKILISALKQSQQLWLTELAQRWAGWTGCKWKRLAPRPGSRALRTRGEGALVRCGIDERVVLGGHWSGR